ncbi:MAG: DUF1887 family CARF protein [Acidobacteriota bacterium]|nr:DUF1887 family CARF protein [Acidobacteriota bacterium]
MKGVACVVSGQNIPHIEVLLHLNPARIALLETDVMRRYRRGDDMLEALELAGIGGETVCGRYRVERQDEPGATIRAMLRVMREHDYCEWSAVIAGGTKPMAIGLWEALADSGGAVYYVDAASPEVLVDLRTGRRETLERRVSLRVFLRSYGFSVGTCRQTRHWERMADVARRVALLDAPVFLESMADEGVRWPPNAPAALIKNLERAFGAGVNSAAEVGAEARRFLSGQWLEIFVWSLLARHAKAVGIRDVEGALQTVHRRSRVRNEIDIACMGRDGLLVFECKTSANRLDAALYKLEAVIGQFRALAVRSVLVAAGLRRDGEMLGALRRRAQHLGCHVVGHDEIVALARKPDSARLVERILLPPRRERGTA